MRKKSLILFALGTVVALGFFFVSNEVRKSRTYTGLVINKFAITKWRLKGRRVKTQYYIEVSASNSKIIGAEVPLSFYQRVKPGDRVIKKKEELYPQIGR